MSQEPKKVDRRQYLKYIAGAGAVVAAAAIDYGISELTKPPPPTPTTIVTTAPPSPTVERKLTVWAGSAFVAANNDWIKKMCLERGQKKGFKVDVSFFPATDFTPKLISAIEAGTPPDLCIHGYNAISFAEQGLTVPLDDVLNELGKDDLHPFKLKQGTVNGKFYVLPDHFELQYHIIRKDLTDAKGIKLPFSNFDEVYEAAKVLTDKDKSIWGIGLPLGKCYDVEGTFMWVWYNLGGKVMVLAKLRDVYILKLKIKLEM